MSTYEKQQEQYVLWLETITQIQQKKINEDRWNMYYNFERYADVNICIDFVCNLSVDQSCVFLIIADIQYEYLPEMLVNLLQISYIY